MNFNFLLFIINTTSSLTEQGLWVINWNFFYSFPLNTSFFFAIKFFLCIAFLILIRGGTPRYRYDYLTKLGWLKFLGFVIFTFILNVFFFFLF